MPVGGAGGVQSLQIMYRPGKESSSADALSQNPQGEPPSSPPDDDVQVATVGNVMDCNENNKVKLLQEQTLALLSKQTQKLK